ncbi:RagB/SusD family nutrient uptake outer membrane protein [Sphingobacterium alkalisoli]|uniref:RagB/SusD family nutrient uptake outer membrane protein n=1 Tax=Sphingobacterium alkalisoli TaxID=1874115 RepID=A0A4U0GXB4_9SPHI|nr:RagB/SusD family nutrient uptake outer membrane protein [Sphingobacterium alkalisoli]TJY63698.1 RagB/SusD family nutrient uptake outer membrane protein [Sphingobacterium alkalisoli]GGH25481.1 membrane protein [Sphingobacterium alkalisoli]
MKINLKKYIGLLIATVVLTSCEKLLEIDPPLNERPSEVIFNSEVTARAALSGAYSQMSANNSFAQEFTLINAVSAGEIATPVITLLDFTTNTYDPITTTRLSSIWTDVYAAIYRFNSIIFGLTDNTALSSALTQQMIAEAKTMRAYCYFNLVNMFGDVPLVLTTDPNVSAFLPRTATSEIMERLITDLEEAKAVLSTAYPTNGGVAGRAQVNKAVATALLAKVYLQVGNLQQAEVNATEVIDQRDTYDLLPMEEIGNVFLKDSKEAILQMGPALIATNGYTVEGSIFLPTTFTTAINYQISDNLLDAFEPDDARYTSWVREVDVQGVSRYVPNKYKNNNQAAATASGRVEVPMLLRLAELYLIRAEARIGANPTGARADINVIRSRAGLGELPATADLAQAVLQERQVEFFCELGNRWYTIKRMGRADAIMSALRPASWESFAQLYPIPQQARNTNPFLTQNEDYR